MPADAFTESQARNRQRATASRACADRAPAVSTSFLHAFGNAQGSWPRAMTAPAEVRRSMMPAAVVAGSTRTREALRPSSSRSEEHTSELQSLMRIAYAVLCLKKNKTTKKRKV